MDSHKSAGSDGLHQDEHQPTALTTTTRTGAPQQKMSSIWQFRQHLNDSVLRGDGWSGTIGSQNDELLLAYGKRVRIHLKDTHDIKKELTDGLFNFIYPEDREDLKDADGILEAAGEDVKQEYKMKKENGDFRRGVLVTAAGNLPQKKIFHIELSRNESKAKDVISAALRMADREEMKSVAIPPLKDYGLHYLMENEPFQLGVLRVMLFEFEARENPICLHMIVTSPTKRNSRDEMLQELRRYTGLTKSLIGSHYYTQ